MGGSRRRLKLPERTPVWAQMRRDELTERFGASRIPIYEALRQLEADGLVTILPNRGDDALNLSLMTPSGNH